MRNTRRSVPDLVALIKEYEAYLADDKLWSRGRQLEFRERFRSFGVGLHTSITGDILTEAKRLLPGDGV